MPANSLVIDVSSELSKPGRLDRFLASAPQLADLAISRSRLQRLIRAGQIKVNGETVQARQTLYGGERIDIDLEAVSIDPNAATAPEAEAIPLDVLYEDEHIIVVDKPIGLVVHPGAGNSGGTLVNALLHHCHGQLSRLDGSVDIERPGIVHRLDKETSGCLVAAKTDLAHRSLVDQFSSRNTRKIYHCVVVRQPSEASGTIRSNIARHPVNRQRMANTDPPAGKHAITDYRVLNAAPNAAWAYIECHLHTGRTHQIRVHMKESLRCPIIGDTLYGNPGRDPVKTGRLMLHAHELGIDHPLSGERQNFTAPLPEAFQRFT